jgi:hypothetical protein
MTEAWAIVVAAIVTALGGLIGMAVHEFRQMKHKNYADHGAVMNKLDAVQEGVNNVSERLTDHIDWHLKK